MKPALLCLLVLLPATLRAEPIVTVDLVRTLPGQQADYLRFVEMNWLRARAEGVRRGFVSDYEVLLRDAQVDGWDLMLRTTYPDAAAHAARETNFAALFATPEFAMQRVDGKGPRDMARILDSGDPAQILGRRPTPTRP